MTGALLEYRPNNASLREGPVRWPTPKAHCCVSPRLDPVASAADSRTRPHHNQRPRRDHRPDGKPPRSTDPRPAPRRARARRWVSTSVLRCTRAGQQAQPLQAAFTVIIVSEQSVKRRDEAARGDPHRRVTAAQRHNDTSRHAAVNVHTKEHTQSEIKTNACLRRDSAPGWSQGWGTRVVGHQGAGIPVASAVGLPLTTPTTSLRR